MIIIVKVILNSTNVPSEIGPYISTELEGYPKSKLLFLRSQIKQEPHMGKNWASRWSEGYSLGTADSAEHEGRGGEGLGGGTWKVPH